MLLHLLQYFHHIDTIEPVRFIDILKISGINFNALIKPDKYAINKGVPMIQEIPILKVQKHTLMKIKTIFHCRS